MKLSEAQRELLARNSPFQGPRPGSNFWPLVDVSDRSGKRICPGEEVDELSRAELVYAEELPPEKRWVIEGRNGPNGQIVPDIEVTHRYQATEAGRRALQESD